MTIDRRLRSGTAPNRTTLAIWLLTALCIGASAIAWQGPRTGSLAPLMLSTVLACAALAAVMFALSRTAWRLLGREAAVATCIMVPLNPVVLAVFLPGPMTGVTWMLAATALGIGCLALRQATLGAALAGALMAAGCVAGMLWPVAGALALLLLFRWLVSNRAAAEFHAYVKAFVAVALPAMAIQHWLAGDEACTAPHLAYGMALLVVLSGTLVLERVPFLAPAVLGGSMAGVAILAACAAVLVPDGCHAQAIVMAPPSGSVTQIAAALLAPGAALAACWYLLRHNEAWLRRWWSEYAAMLAVATVGGLLLPELAAVAALLAAMPLGWLAAQLILGHHSMRAKGWWPAIFGVLLVVANVVHQTALSPEDQAAPRTAVLAAASVPAR